MRRKRDEDDVDLVPITDDDGTSEMVVRDGVLIVPAPDDPIAEAMNRAIASAEPKVSPRSAAAIAEHACEWRQCPSKAEHLVPVGADPYLPHRQLEPPTRRGWAYLCSDHFDRAVLRDWDEAVRE